MTGTPTGTALRTLRRTADMTLDDVADAAGVSASYLSRAESGEVNPTPKWIAHVMEVIGDRIDAAARAA